MKVGRDYSRRKEWRLSSWKRSQDPAPGELTCGAGTLGYPQSKLKQGTVVKFRGAPWINQSFSGFFVIGQYINVPFTHDVIINEGEVSWTYNLEQSYNLLPRTTVNSSGHLETWVWVEDSKGWQLTMSYPRGSYDTYNICNEYGTSNISMIHRLVLAWIRKGLFPKTKRIGTQVTGQVVVLGEHHALECKNGLEEFIKYSHRKYLV
ncbi:putative non-specific serine/threonine protein kinase [Helianthus annuus]|nr:putative non-specific serine/threonine protein kinase [Helianthus annuus]